MEEYQDLFEVYIYLENQFVFGNGVSVLHTKTEEEILNDLKFLEVNFENVLMNRGDYIFLKFKINEECRLVDKTVRINNIVKNLTVKKCLIL